MFRAASRGHYRVAMPLLRIRAVALVAITLILALAPLAGGPGAAPASAAEADCVGNGYTDGGYEYVEVDRRLVPPPMRALPWDCAIRPAGDEFDESLLPDGGYAQSVQYMVLYVDMGFEELVELLRAFERSGYSAGDDINVVDDGTGPQSSALGTDDLAALDPAPGLVVARFSNGPSSPAPSTPGSNIYELSWTDGARFESRSGIDGRPQLLASIILTEPFGRAAGLADPSTLSGLGTIAERIPDAAQTTVIAAGSVMLMLVVGWPSTLLNSVVGSRYAQFVRWADGRAKERAARRTRRPAPTADDAADEAAVGAPRPSRLPGWLMWPGFALAALIGALTDPDFGWNAMSLRLVVTLALSFLLFNLLVWEVVKRVALRLQPDSKPYLRFRWGSLLLVVAAVLIARILDFEPGVIFGLVAGVAFAVALLAGRSAVIVLVGSGIALALALVAWIGYSGLAPVAQAAPGNLLLVFVTEFLAGVTVKGVSSLPLALLPLGTLDGAKLMRWRKWVWGVAYAIGLAAFMLVLLTIPKAWGEVSGDFVRWLVIFGVYAVVAVGVWAVNSRLLARRTTRSAPATAPVGEEPEATTID